VDDVGLQISGCAQHILGMVFDQVDLNLRDGKVGQLHEGVLHFAAATIGTDLTGSNGDGARGELAAEHVSEGEGEVSVVRGECSLDHLVVSGRVLGTGGRGIVAEWADALGAIVTGETTVAYARLGAILVPELVVGAIERTVVVVHLAVLQAQTVSRAAVGACCAAASTALETFKATAETSGIVASATTGALNVGVGGGVLGIKSIEGCGKGELSVPVSFEETTGRHGDEVICRAVVLELVEACGSPRWAERALAQGAVTSTPVLVAVAHIRRATSTVAGAPTWASSLGDSQESEGREDLHDVVLVDGKLEGKEKKKGK